jgi:hypothetical protein
LSFVFKCIAVGDLTIKRGGLGPINRFTLPQVCTCSKPGPVFTTSSVVFFFMLNELRWEVIVRFIDGGVIVHHYLLKRAWRYQRVIRISISKKNRQHNDQKKKIQKEKQRSTKHYTEACYSHFQPSYK